jgi:hypothetical protein
MLNYLESAYYHFTCFGNRKHNLSLYLQVAGQMKIAELMEDKVRKHLRPIFFQFYSVCIVS